ncbi:MAG: SDR family NAD(P)-dependent oxidoreductase [Candidatus Nanopelagicaceae bacterium]|jgi:NAD(P)-dependent dehydrogenase (short-subunit alcohol dehydrogenase family)
MPATESKPIFVALCLPTAKWRYWPHFGDAKSSALGQAYEMALAFVTGASRGLGYEVAKALKARGDEVIGISKDRQRAEAASRELGIAFELMDCQQISQVRSVSQELLAKYGTPEILVLAHGVMSEKMAKTLKTNDQEWARVLDINLNSVFTLVNSIAAPMAEARNGRVIIFSACLGRMSGPGNAGGLAPYRISKAGVNALVRNLAHETNHGARGFLVDAICPNHSRTDMGGADAPRSAAEGAATAIWLATRTFNPGDQTGLLWEDQEVVPW